MLSQLLLLALFLLTAAAVTSRPLRISEGWWPAGAVLLALLMGAIPLATAVGGLESSLDVLAFFSGLLLLAWALRVGGLLDRLLDQIETWGRGEPRRLLIAVAVATVVVTALLSNDAAALLFAPQVLDRIGRRGVPLAPFVLTMAFAANAASALLPISNPVNLLILDRSAIPLATYLSAVTPGALAGLAITVVGCLVLTGRQLPTSVMKATEERPPAPPHPERGGALTALVLGLVLTDIAFAAARLPIGPPTLLAGLLGVVLVRAEDGSRALPRGLGWSILALVAGFSIIASGLEHSTLLAHAASQVTAAGSGWVAGVVTGVATAVISGVINNLPAALLVTASLAAAHHLGSLALPVIVGADFGPNLAPFGSLSTILILAAVRRRAEPVPWSQLWRLGMVLGPLALLASVGLVALAR